MTRRALPRRQLLIALGAGAAVVTAASCKSGQLSPPTGASTYSAAIGPTVLPTAAASPTLGRLLIVQGGNLAVFDLARLQSVRLTNLPSGTYASSPALSHDGKRLAYTYYAPPS